MKIVGYFFAVAGLILLASSVESFGKMIFGVAPFLSAISKTYAIIFGGALVVIGLFFLLSGGKEKQMQEVPIYHGKSIVGYRRH